MARDYKRKRPRSDWPKRPDDLPRLGTLATAQRLFGVTEYRLRKWVQDGRLSAYWVEGVGTPRYDLEQISRLVQAEGAEGPDGRPPARRRPLTKSYAAGAA
jgi:hypothetical protein